MAIPLLCLISRSPVASIRSCKPPRGSNPSTTRSAMVASRKRGDGLSTRRWLRGSREIVSSVPLVLKSYSVEQLELRWSPPLKGLGPPQFYRAPSTNFPFGPSNSLRTLPTSRSIRCSGSAAMGPLSPPRDGRPSQEAMELGRWRQTARSLPPAMLSQPRCSLTWSPGPLTALLSSPWLSTIFRSPPPHPRVRPRMKPSPSLLRKTRWRLSVGRPRTGKLTPRNTARI